MPVPRRVTKKLPSACRPPFPKRLGDWGRAQAAELKRPYETLVAWARAEDF
jgi:hypothetical protein